MTQVSSGGSIGPGPSPQALGTAKPEAAAAGSVPPPPPPELGWTVGLVPREGLLEQMARLRALKSSSPAAAARLCDRSERLVQLSAQGFLGEMKALIAECMADEEWGHPPPLWYTARIFRAAASEGHVAVVRWLIQGCGVYQHTIPPLADVLHLVVDRTPPSFDGSPPTQTCHMLTLLAENGFNINASRKVDFWTPLHVACARNLTEVGIHLIALGADVNAVGKHDIMPLNLTQRMYDMMLRSYNRQLEALQRQDEEELGEAAEAAGEGSDNNSASEPALPEKPAAPPLHQALLNKGARPTWRRDPPPPPPSATLTGGFGKTTFTGSMEAFRPAPGGQGSSGLSSASGGTQSNMTSVSGAAGTANGGSGLVRSSGQSGQFASTSGGFSITFSSESQESGAQAPSGTSGTAGGQEPTVYKRADGGFMFSTGM